MFADNVTIHIKAGRGGDGRLSFLREKYRAMGGPDGGDGGHGGSIILQATHNLTTLAAFRNQKTIMAESGEAGGGNRKHGKSGEDVILKVPEGTQVWEGEQLLADLVDDGQELVLAKGGRGGFGNAHFTSSTRQAPRAMELGDAGEERDVRLELKLVADVGLIGLPNAGKSTLLSVISQAKPEIGDYPFTTLTPNLGVVDIAETAVLFADIPGLIEGASEGKGLGDQFLRHIERTAVLLHLIDPYSNDLAQDYAVIQAELKGYKVDLATKPQIVVLTKTEGMTPAQLTELRKVLKKVTKDPIVAISASAHQGLDELLHTTLPLVLAARKLRAEIVAEEAIPVIDETTQGDLWRVQREKDGYVVSGAKLERFAARTDRDNDAAVERLRDILHKEGVDKELRRQGAEPGALVKLGSYELEWLG